MGDNKMKKGFLDSSQDFIKWQIKLYKDDSEFDKIGFLKNLDKWGFENWEKGVVIESFIRRMPDLSHYSEELKLCYKYPETHDEYINKIIYILTTKDKDPAILELNKLTENLKHREDREQIITKALNNHSVDTNMRATLSNWNIGFYKDRT